MILSKLSQAFINEALDHFEDDFYILFTKSFSYGKPEFLSLKSNMHNFKIMFGNNYEMYSGSFSPFYLSYKGVLFPTLLRTAPTDSDRTFSIFTLRPLVASRSYSRFEKFFATNNLNILNKKERTFFLKNMSSFHIHNETYASQLILVDFFDLKF